jgi:hypothetical protein
LDFFVSLVRIFDSRNTPNPQIPQEAVFSINNGMATVLNPHSNMATALKPEMLHANNPKGPPMMTRPQCNSFSGKSGMSIFFPETTDKVLLTGSKKTVTRKA